MSSFDEILAAESEARLREDLSRAIAIEGLRKLQIAAAVRPLDRSLLWKQLRPVSR